MIVGVLAVPLHSVLLKKKNALTITTPAPIFLHPFEINSMFAQGALCKMEHIILSIVCFQLSGSVHRQQHVPA